MKADDDWPAGRHRIAEFEMQNLPALWIDWQIRA
jgi:hypothetical protein